MISVLMPVYNSELYLEDAVQSILDQTYKNFEFIIIDDGSVDNSLAILESFKDNRIKLVKKKNNTGYTSLLNESINYAKYDYLARMDSDDVSNKDRLLKQFKFLEKNKDYSVVGSNIRLINTKGQFIRNGKYPETDKQIKSKLSNFSTFAHPACLIRKKKLIDIGGYRTIFEPSEDYDLWTRLALNSKMYNIQEYLLDYRIHGKSVSSKRGIDQQIKTFFIQKNFDNLKNGNPDLVDINNLTKIDLETCSKLFNDLKNLKFLIYYHKIKIDFNEKSYLTAFFKTIFILFFYPKKLIIKIIDYIQKI